MHSEVHIAPSAGRGVTDLFCIQCRGKRKSRLYFWRLWGSQSPTLSPSRPSRLHPRGVRGGGRAWLPRPAPSFPPSRGFALGHAGGSGAGSSAAGRGQGQQQGGDDASSGAARSHRLSGQRQPRGDPPPSPAGPYGGAGAAAQPPGGGGRRAPALARKCRGRGRGGAGAGREGREGGGRPTSAGSPLGL